MGRLLEPEGLRILVAAERSTSPHHIHTYAPSQADNPSADACIPEPPRAPGPGPNAQPARSVRQQGGPLGSVSSGVSRIKCQSWSPKETCFMCLWPSCLFHENEKMNTHFWALLSTKEIIDKHIAQVG